MSCEGLLGAELQVCQAARAAAEAANAATRLAQGTSAVENAVALLGAVGTLLLPIAALVFVFRLWPTLRDIFETRKFTLKIGGFELSAQEVTDQLRAQIDDLQAKVAELERRSARPAIADAEAEPVPAPLLPSGPRRILWVDDSPSNNAAMIAAFRNEGIEVETVLSGREAIAMLWADPEHFAAVITDQGRVEDGRFLAEAGTALVREMRGGGIDVPVAVFTSAAGVRSGTGALAAGAETVTASAVDIRAFVERHVGVIG